MSTGDRQSVYGAVKQGLGLVWSAGRRSSLLLVVLSSVSGVAAAVVPLATASLLQRLFASGSLADMELEAVLTPLGLVVAALIAERSVGVWRDGLMEVLAFEVRVAAEREIVATATAVPLETFERPDFYDNLQRASEAASVRPMQLAQAMLNTVTAVAGGLGTGIAVVVLEPLMFGAALLSFVPAWWVVQRRGAVRLRFLIEATPTERVIGYFSAVLSDRASAKEIRLFGASRFLQDKLRRAVDRRRRELGREVRELRRVDLQGLVVSGAATTAAWVIIAVFALSGRGTPSTIIAFVFAFQRLRGFLATLSWGLAEAAEAGILLRDVRAVTDAAVPVSADGHRNRTDELGPLRSMSLQQVSYRYPGTDRPALHRLTTTLWRGEFVAVVGPNGSGKSTLVKLLTALLPPTEGVVVWNDRPLQAGHVQRLRGRAGVVFQDSFQFSLTVRENVTLGRPDDDGQAAAAVGEVGLQEVVARLPDGMETLLGRQFEGGTDLSGGQWQRLMVARGLLDRGAEVVILDEASSGLDPVAEFELVKSIKELGRNALVVVVSHRLSSIAEADRVVVMDQGRIVEEGRPTDLLDSGGRFADMFNVQARALGLSRPTLAP